MPACNKVKVFKNDGKHSLSFPIRFFVARSRIASLAGEIVTPAPGETRFLTKNCWRVLGCNRCYINQISFKVLTVVKYVQLAQGEA